MVKWFDGGYGKIFAEYMLAFTRQIDRTRILVIRGKAAWGKTFFVSSIFSKNKVLKYSDASDFQAVSNVQIAAIVFDEFKISKWGKNLSVLNKLVEFENVINIKYTKAVMNNVIPVIIITNESCESW